ncbi:hypothetical protein NDZ80_002182 [Vibrio vulnificus]|nr:hypothetical protein [Vibrio vulnificus]
MHPLQNGSQVTERPANKPVSGLPGYFTESGENNVPSYPGADWFNHVIDEFSSALAVCDVDFDPESDQNLAKAFDTKLSKTNFKDFSKVFYSSTLGLDLTKDCRFELQAAWQACADNGWLFYIDEQYLIDAYRHTYPDGLERWIGLQVPSNSRCQFGINAHIKLMPNSLPTYYVINFYLSDNFRIYYPKVIADKPEHNGIDGEWGHCYNVVSCSNGLVLEPQAYDAWGDGIYVGLEYWSPTLKQIENVFIQGAKLINSSRNGLSFCSGKNVHITIKEASGADRIAPRALVDVEPEYGYAAPGLKPTLENCSLHLHSTTKGDYGALSGLLIYLSDLNMDKFELSYTVSGDFSNVNTPLQINLDRSQPIDGYLESASVNIANPKNYPIFHRSRVSNGIFTLIDRATVSNPNSFGIPGANKLIKFEGFGPGVASGNFSLNLNVLDDANISYLYEASNADLENVKVNFGLCRNKSIVGDWSVFNGSKLGASCKFDVGFSNNDPYVTFFSSSILSRGLTKFYVKPTTPDGITLTLSTKDSMQRRIKSLKLEVSSFPLIITKGDTNLIFNGTSVNAVSTLSPLAELEIYADGSNRYINPISGNFTTQ